MIIVIKYAITTKPVMKHKATEKKKLISGFCFLMVFNIHEMLYGWMIYKKMNMHKQSKDWIFLPALTKEHRNKSTWRMMSLDSLDVLK